MNTPINWTDQYFFSKERLVLTKEQLPIPGLRTFGRHTIQSAVPPLYPHFHENSFEITFVTKGSLLFYVNDQEYKVNGGEAFIAFPNEVHSTNENPMSLGEIYWLQLDISSYDHFLYLNKEAARTIIQELKLLKHHSIRTDNKEVRKLLVKAFSLTNISNNKYMIASYLTIYLHLLIAFSNKTQFPLTPDIGRSLEYIFDHITEEISLDFLANYSNLSTSQYKLKFKTELGTSPRNFINQQKIEYSKSILVSEDSITQVAQDLGFSTSSYFSVVFKRYTSFTPSEYISRHKKERV